MKTTLRWVGLWMLVVALGSSLALAATSRAGGSGGGARGGSGGGVTPGLEAARSISTITGVAISPLLGVSVVGAYQWFKASSEERPRLPWYTSPWFWVLGLLVVGLAATKDVFGAALPPGLKKPADVAETIENKASGLVATGAFVPFIASIFGSFTQSSALGSTGLAMINPMALLNLLTVPLAMAAFVLVWLMGHAINILILISPWGGVDAALKGFRTFLLSSVTVTSFVNPWVGAVFSLILIVIAYFIAGWTFRLTVFGTVWVWDFLTVRRKRFQPGAAYNWAFTSRKINQVPIRTYGRLSQTPEGRFVFHYRPWLVLAPRMLEVPEGRYAVGRELFNPTLLRVEGEQTETTFTFPPRYRTHEETLARLYRLEVRDAGLLKGFKAAWRWLKGLFGLNRPAAAAIA